MFLILNYLLILIDSQIVAWDVLNPLSVNQTFCNSKLYGKIYKQMTIKKMIKFTSWIIKSCNLKLYGIWFIKTVYTIR